MCRGGEGVASCVEEGREQPRTQEIIKRMCKQRILFFNFLNGPGYEAREGGEGEGRRVACINFRGVN